MTTVADLIDVLASGGRVTITQFSAMQIGDRLNAWADSHGVELVCEIRDDDRIVITSRTPAIEVPMMIRDGRQVTIVECLQQLQTLSA